MESSLTFGRLVRNLLLLALLGFVAVLFAKPVLTAAAVILVFALIGFLLWLPLHTLVFGRRAPLRHSLDQSRLVSARMLVGLGVGCRQVCWLQRRFLEKGWVWATAAGPILLEVGSGALLGSLLVWAHEGMQKDSEVLPVGILAGMVAGVLVLWSRRQPVGEE